VRIVDIRERSVPISRYADPALPSGGLTTSIVAVVTDATRNGRPVIGYGFGSMGRFAQGGLIRERFAPRLLGATDLATADGGGLDPFRAWHAMMANEKAGGHGERCVAVGTLDMALWDAAAKLADLPLHRLLAERLPEAQPARRGLAAYAGGGYRYPADDLARLADEIRRLRDLGYASVKLKIGGVPLAQDLRRIEAALALLPADRLAVDAMNAYGPAESLAAADALAPHELRWFEDICDPLDFETHGAVAARYDGAIAAGEALSPRRRRGCSTATAACAPRAISWSSIPCTATGCRAISGSSARSRRRAGRALPSGPMAGISSASTSSPRSASAASR